MLAKNAGFSMGSPDHVSMSSAESEESEEGGAVRRAALLEVALGMTKAGARRSGWCVAEKPDHVVLNALAESKAVAQRLASVEATSFETKGSSFSCD